MFSLLPLEIQYTIFMLLPVESILSLTSTNKKYHCLCNQEYLWERLLNRDYEDVTQYHDTINTKCDHDDNLADNIIKVDDVRDGECRFKELYKKVVGSVSIPLSLGSKGDVYPFKADNIIHKVRIYPNDTMTTLLKSISELVNIDSYHLIFLNKEGKILLSSYNPNFRICLKDRVDNKKLYFIRLENDLYY